MKSSPEKKKSPDTLPAGIASIPLELMGHRSRYLQAGSGPPVVLVHGGASDGRDWLPVMAALAGRFTFYAPDLPGFGQSDRKEQGYYLADFIKFIAEFRERLGLENPALVGHSLGGRICLGAALPNAQAWRKLVLIDSSGLGKVTKFGVAIMTAMWGLRRALRRPQPYPRFLTLQGEDTDWLCLESLPAVQTPTLLIWKRHDPYLPLRHAQQALQMLPQARLEIIEGFGHAPHMPGGEIFNRLLADYLA